MSIKLNRKTIGYLIPLIGLALFIYIIHSIGLKNISQTFLKIPIEYYLFSIVLTVPKVGLWVYKWRYICRLQKMEFKFLYLTRIFLITLFYGSITPAAIGFHLRIYYLQKKNYPIGKLLANSILDTYSGFMVGSFLALIGTILIISINPGFFPLILAFFIFEVVLFVVFITKKSGSKIFNFIIKTIIPSKYKENFEGSVDILYEDIPKIRDMTWPFILEAIIWIIAATQVYIIALAFPEFNVPFHIFILLSIISVVVTGIIPISIGGLGVREGTLIALLSVYGVSPETAFVISIAGYIIKHIIPGFIGVATSFFIRD
jgi:hypothetical protein